ncbi:MAG TPA: M17 family peptidase N-terminal domain-containing protein, partial [Xanthobacteraceae bacterium]|nr:M17 family peptidase N-terminal domain-containing protein [Xanthobacteraceae bacterium]
MKVSFSALDLPQQGVVVVGVLEDRELSPSARRLDTRLEGAITRAMGASRFRGKKDQTLAILAPTGSELARIQLVGWGKPAEIDAQRALAAGGQI